MINSHDQLRLNNIKNRFLKHQPIAPADVEWMFTTIEIINQELINLTERHEKLKYAVNLSQMRRGKKE